MSISEKIMAGLMATTAGALGALAVCGVIVMGWALFGDGRAEAFGESDRCRDLGARMATAGLLDGEGNGRFDGLPPLVGDNGDDAMRYDASSYDITLDWLNECHKGPYDETLALIQIVQARKTNILLRELLEQGQAPTAPAPEVSRQ